MTSMIDRVAEAIIEECAWDITTSASRRAARAAIEAMREPTSWMLNEAVQISEDQRGNVAGFEYWHRMIDAALGEEEREAKLAAVYAALAESKEG